MLFSRIAFACIFGLLVSPSEAAHLGVIGPTYPIGEQSALDLITQRLKRLEKSGELAKLLTQQKSRAISSLKSMTPVVGLGTVKKRSQRLIDPSVTYPHSITADDGRIIVPAGTTINPLEIMPFSKTLVFFDGRDPKQVQSVHKLMARKGQRVKPILTAGSWFDLTKAWKTQVYFDQHGTLSRRFGLRAVPSVIRQHEKMLILEEIPVEDLADA